MNSALKTRSSHFLDCLRLWRIWYLLAMQDILLRYRGSVLGPFWITLSTAVTVCSMGFLYGVLFKIDRNIYLPYFTTGVIAWSFISMIITESTKILIDNKHFLENIQLPCILYIFRLIFRNVIVLLHNLPIYIIIILIYHINPATHLVLFIPALFFLCLNGVFYGTLISFISARFPDVGAVVVSILQVVFFITPITWSPNILPEKFQIFLLLNPFSYLVSLIRNPLLGIPFTLNDLIATMSLTIFGFILFYYVSNKYSKRVIFWV